MIIINDRIKLLGSTNNIEEHWWESIAPAECTVDFGN
jgi:hypothetical protein